MLLAEITNQDPWNTLGEIDTLQNEINRLCSGNANYEASRNMPLLNIWANQEETVITAEVPGIDSAKLDINVEDQTLAIKYNPKMENSEGMRYLIRERKSGGFSGNVKLPYRVAADKTEARFKNGILTIILKRPDAEKPKKINVKSE